MGDVPEFASFGQYSTEALRLLFRAREELKRLGGEAVLPEHLLLALLRPEAGPAYESLTALRVPIEETRRRLEDVLRGASGDVRPDDLPLSTRLKAVLDRAVAAAPQQVGARELLASLTVDASGEAAALLREAGVTPDALRSAS